MKRSLAALLSAFLLYAQAETTWQVQSGLWSDDRPQNSDYQTPLSVHAKSSGNLLNDSVYYRLDARAGTHDFFQDEKAGIVREAMLSLPVAGGDFMLGRLLLPWGRADQINPTDSLVTRDYQWRTTVDDDQKSGNDGFAWQWDTGSWRVTTVWLPHMRSSRLPWIEALKDASHNEPDDHRNTALRLDHTGQQLDWGLSLYEGINTAPSLQTKLDRIPDFTWTNYRVRRTGFDAAMNLGASTVRAELAQTQVLSQHNDTASRLYGQPADDTKLVLGMDRYLTDSINLNVQLLGQWINDDYPPLHTFPSTLQPVARMQRLVNQQPERHLYGASLRLSQTLLQDTLTLELAGIAYGEGQGSLWRPRILFKVDDHNSITVGGDRFFGSNNGMYGALQDNNVWFVQWTFSP